MLATGQNDEMLVLAAPDAQVIDLTELAVTPGLIEPNLTFMATA